MYLGQERVVSMWMIITLKKVKIVSWMKPMVTPSQMVPMATSSLRTIHSSCLDTREPRSLRCAVSSEDREINIWSKNILSLITSKMCPINKCVNEIFYRRYNLCYQSNINLHFVSTSKEGKYFNQRKVEKYLGLENSWAQNNYQSVCTWG